MKRFRFEIPLRAVVASCCLAIAAGVAAAATIEDIFHNPPPSARPHTWWHWMNGNVTKEGITLDLEAMARVGIGGAQIFNVADTGSCNIPQGPADYLSPQFLGLVKHAATEAKRLGLELCMHNGPGWSSSGGPWIDPAHSMQLLVSAETQATAAGHLRLPQPETRRGFYRDVAVLAFPTPATPAAAAFRIRELATLTGAAQRYLPPTEPISAPPGSATGHGQVIDLTKRMDSAGNLDWAPPAAGAWTIVRFGHTTSGETNHPASASGVGLECDKLSREAMDLHWQKGIQPILDYLGPVGSHGLNNLLIDSYEVGPNTWTPRFREEFTQRRGYDPLLFLPVLAGHVIDDGDVTARFLWDFRRTVSDLFADNYYAYFAELCHKAGLLASVEPYDGPYECLANGRGYDVIMGEFWSEHGQPDADFNWEGTINASVKVASSVAHVNGKTFVGAESFTSGPPNGRWQNYPGMLKQLGECVWCLGINRYIFHRYAQQPWSADVVPGMTMGQWGTHFDRTNTWWEQSRAWMAYIGRSQALLQQGNFGADVLFFGGENSPSGGVNRTELKRAGHDFDAIGTDLIHQLSVDNGALVLPGGMRYRLLVMPNETTMTPLLAAKLRQLVEAGACVLGPKPTRAPSLAPSAKSDAALAKEADALWGTASPAAGRVRTVGKGRVLSGGTPEAALKLLGVAPQVVCPPQLRWIERRSADNDIYFVSNQSGKAFNGEVRFRVAGMAPALFDPVTGATAPAQVWSGNKNSTGVTLLLPPSGSVFVVFGGTAAKGPAWLGHSFAALAAAPEPLATPHTLVIHAAKYGVLHATLPQCVDVTEPLRDALKDGALHAMANNDLAGDPVFNTPKALFVEYLAAGKSHSLRITENQPVVLPAPNESGPVEITAAVYGALPATLVALPKPVAVDVTAKLAALVKDGGLTVKVDNDLSGKDLLWGVLKQLQVEYTLDGQTATLTSNENDVLNLPPAPWHSVAPLPAVIAGPALISFAKERHLFTKPDATNLTVETPAPAPPLVVAGPWQVTFQAKRGAPAATTLPALAPLDTNADPAIRYFSGTAVWHTSFQLPATPAANPDAPVLLDLGRVCVIAEVKLNGHDLGILWHEPFRIDVAKHLKPGTNTLEVAVTNLWVNRLIGDEQLPADVEWNGQALAKWPDWFVAKQPRPSADRVTFTTWHHWKKSDPLQPSGLIGPVLLRYGTLTPLR